MSTYPHKQDPRNVPCFYLLLQSLRYKYYDHYSAIYYLFLDYPRQHLPIPIKEIQKSHYFEVIQQRQRHRKLSYQPVFQHTPLNSGLDSLNGGYNKRSSGEYRHSYIQDATKELHALKDISLNSTSSIFQSNSPCSTLDLLGSSNTEGRHRSPGCYAHVISSQQMLSNNISPLMTSSSTAAISQLNLPAANALSNQYYQSNISANSSPHSSTLNGLNVVDYLQQQQQYQDNLTQPSSTSPSSLSSHSVKLSSPTIGYGSMYSSSPNYTLVNSQFSSIINEMESLTESNLGTYERSVSGLRCSDGEGGYATDTPSYRFSYSDSPAGIIAQYSNSTDEGVEADIEDSFPQRLSYASSSSSSGVGVPNTSSFSNNESYSSFHALTNQNSFEGYKDKIKMEVTSSLPSCTAPSNYISSSTKTKKRKTPTTCPSSWRKYNAAHNPPVANQFFRCGMKSPSDFREGRRASDGFVTQIEPNGRNAETSSLKETTSKDNLFHPDSYHLTEKSKGFLELHELPKENYDLKSFYGNILGPEEEVSNRRQHSYLSSTSSSPSYKAQYESNKFKYPSPRSPTYTIRQSPYYDQSYSKGRDNFDKDSVFLDANPPPPCCKSPTKFHQKWQQSSNSAVPKGTAASGVSGYSCSQIIPSLQHSETSSPSKNRRKLFRQLKHKQPSNTSNESCSSMGGGSSGADEIPTIIEDSSNGFATNDDYIDRSDYLEHSSILSLHNEPANQHITWNSTIPPQSDVFQF